MAGTWPPVLRAAAAPPPRAGPPAAAPTRGRRGVSARGGAAGSGGRAAGAARRVPGALTGPFFSPLGADLSLLQEDLQEDADGCECARLAVAAPAARGEWPGRKGGRRRPGLGRRGRGSARRGPGPAGAASWREHSLRGWGDGAPGSAGGEGCPVWRPSSGSAASPTLASPPERLWARGPLGVCSGGESGRAEM